MTRVRLRPQHPPERLAEIYAEPHDHTRWQDHVLRIDATIELARALAGGPLSSAADLSCGSGAVVNALDVERRHLGDFAPGYEYTGPIEQTVNEIPHVDLFVNTETLEHVDDPDLVLKAIRGKTDRLILSTPVDNWTDRNIEHLWAWSEADVVKMLAAAGFDVVDSFVLDFRQHGPDYYAFGLWACR